MRQSHHARPRTKSLRFETLEERTPLAGNVTARIVGNDLVIRGDSTHNDVFIRSTGGLDNFEVAGGRRAGAPTTINGTNTPFRFSNRDFSDDVRIIMKGGRDRVRIHGANSGDGDFDVWNQMRIWMGPGNDKVELRYVQAGESGAAESDIIVDLGKGKNTFYSSYVNVDDDLRIFTSSKQQDATRKTRLDMYNTTAGDQLQIELPWSTGVANLFNCHSDDLIVRLYSADDKLSIRKSSANASLLDGGDGTDSLNLFENTSSFSYTSFLPPTSSNIIYS